MSFSTDLNIPQIINSLSNAEDDNGKTHLEKTLTPALTEQQKALDSIARLIGGWRDIGAACYNGTDILVANNTGLPVLPKAIWKEFNAISTGSNVEGLNDIIDKTFAAQIFKDERLSRLKSDGINSINRLSRDKDIGDISELLRTMSHNLKNNRLTAAGATAKEILKYIPNTVKYAEIRAKLGNVYRPVQDIERASEYINSNKSQFATPEPNFIRGEKDVHAELKIMDVLLQSKSITKEPIPKYIGNSKLCCAACHLTINLALEKTNAQDAVKTAGTHGKFYAKWPTPHFLEQNGWDQDLSKKLTLLAEQGTQYTRDIDTRPLSPPPGIRDLPYRLTEASSQSMIGPQPRPSSSQQTNWGALNMIPPKARRPVTLPTPTTLSPSTPIGTVGETSISTSTPSQPIGPQPRPSSSQQTNWGALNMIPPQARRPVTLPTPTTLSPSTPIGTVGETSISTSTPSQPIGPQPRPSSSQQTNWGALNMIPPQARRPVTLPTPTTLSPSTPMGNVGETSISTSTPSQPIGPQPRPSSSQQTNWGALNMIPPQARRPVTLPTPTTLSPSTPMGNVGETSISTSTPSQPIGPQPRPSSSQQTNWGALNMIPPQARRPVTLPTPTTLSPSTPMGNVGETSISTSTPSSPERREGTPSTTSFRVKRRATTLPTTELTPHSNSNQQTFSPPSSTVAAFMQSQPLNSLPPPLVPRKKQKLSNQKDISTFPQ